MHAQPPGIFDIEQLAQRWPRLTRREAHDVMTRITTEQRQRLIQPEPNPEPARSLKLSGLDAYLAQLLGGTS